MKKYCKNENVHVKKKLFSKDAQNIKKLLFYYIYYVYIKTHTWCIYLRKICYVYILN